MIICQKKALKEKDYEYQELVTFTIMVLMELQFVPLLGHANVNVSLISYYLKNKQGLLEHMTIDYFETYLELLEELTNDSSSLNNRDTFFK